MSSVQDVHKILAENGLISKDQIANFTSFIETEKGVSGDLSKLKHAELTKVGSL